MELKKIVLGVSLALGVAAFANAADPVKDQGHGNFRFHGTIIDAPCSIMSDENQDVYMGQIANSALANEGKSKAVDFSIQLSQCVLEEGKSNTVTATFTGPNGTVVDSFGVGKTAGASLILRDGNSAQIKPGQATNAQSLASGNNTLNFSAYLQGNPGKDNVVDLGEFSTTASFVLAYQ